MNLSFAEHQPRLAPDVFVAPGATVIGRVSVGPGSSVWFGTIVRADVEAITIGSRSNLQDRVVVHVSRNRHPTRIGDDVTVGHGVVLHGCSVSDRVLVGIGSIVLDGAQLEEDCMVAAGTLVPPGMRIPSGQLAMGSPARIVRPLREAELAHLRESAANYVALARVYAGQS